MNMPTTTGVAPETPVRNPESGGPDGALTELAALEAARTEKRHLLDAPPPRPGRSSAESSACPPAANLTTCRLLQRYYWSEPAAEVLGHEPEELAGLALGHLKLAEVRPPGSATVDVQTLPDGRSVIRLVTDDMPYLVDSVTAEVVRQGVTLAHIVHPVVVVRRDLRGTIKAFCDSSLADSCGPDALTESWMAVVVDGTLDEEAGADLTSGLRTVSTTSARSTRTPQSCRPASWSSPPGSRSCRPPPPAPIPPMTRPRPPRSCAGWRTATSSSWGPVRSTSSRAGASRPPVPCTAPDSASCVATPT